MAKQVLTNLDFNSVAKVVNLPNPTANQDAATKAYVDAAIEQLAQKDNVRVRTSSNISLASPGATLDGVTMVVNDRVLVAGQTTQSENGIYIYNGSSVAMTRSADANAAIELVNAIVPVDEGTSAGTVWRQTAVNITLGSTAILFVAFGTVAAAASETSAGIAEIATQAETDTGTDDLRIVTPLKLANYAGRKLKFSQDIGDGSATQYTITHNLNTRDLTAIVRRNSGQYDEVIVDIEFPTVNTAVARFASAPASNAFKFIVLG
jgi:hypothetical protein